MNEIFNQNIPVLAAQALFVLSAIVQFWLFYRLYGKLVLFKDEGQSNTQVPVSIIIAARNEVDNLTAHLPHILNQDYPKFEVVVVNDGSYDGSDELLEGMQADYPHLKVVTRPENDRFDGGKKLAITLGVKAAKYERFLFTDADCKPLSDKWVSSMSKHFQSEDNLVLGYSPYQRKGGLLNILICFEAFYIAANYLGLALSGMPYMGVGRNLSYSRGSFFGVGGFRKHYALSSGDDDLFVNEVATPKNTRVCIDPNAIVESIPKKSLKEYFRQKRRHITTSHRYKSQHRFLLALQPISLLFFWVAAGVLLVFHSWMYIVLGVIGLRVLIQIFIFNRLSRTMGHGRIIFLAPLLELVLFSLTGMAHLANATTKQTKWTN